MNKEFEKLNKIESEFIESRLNIAKLMIWNLYSKNYGIKFEDFQYNETCVTYLEEYLETRIRPRILKWKLNDDGITITRVKTMSGWASSKHDHIQEVLNLIHDCSILFGQCIAKIFDGKWEFVNELIHIDVNSTSMQTYWKCLKFVTLGNEDSLSSFIQFIRNFEQNKEICDKILKRLKLNQQDYKKIQTWTDEGGQLESIVVIGRNNEIINTVYIDIIQNN